MYYYIHFPGLFFTVFNLFFQSSPFSYVFSAPDQLLESMPGTLMLTDCLEACQANESCGAVNYETGLCVLFSSNADKLPGMYLFKCDTFICIFNFDKCAKAHPEIEAVAKRFNPFYRFFGIRITFGLQGEINI